MSSSRSDLVLIWSRVSSSIPPVKREKGNKYYCKTDMKFEGRTKKVSLPDLLSEEITVKVTLESTSHQAWRGSWCCSLVGSLQEALAGVARTGSSLQTDLCSPITPWSEQEKKQTHTMNHLSFSFKSYISTTSSAFCVTLCFVDNDGQNNGKVFMVPCEQTSVKSSSIPVVGSRTTERPEWSGDREQLSSESTQTSLCVTLENKRQPQTQGLHKPKLGLQNVSNQKEAMGSEWSFGDIKKN